MKDNGVVDFSGNPSVCGQGITEHNDVFRALFPDGKYMYVAQIGHDNGMADYLAFRRINLSLRNRVPRNV